MNKAYEIVKYSPEYESQIVELQTRYHWGPNVALNAAYLKWKYDQNPYIKPPRLIYMALCNGQVVGMRGIYGAKWQTGDPSQTLPVLCAGDLVIAPEHRNRGLFTKIMHAALDDMASSGYRYVFSLSAGPVTLLGSLAMGWRSIGSLQELRWKQAGQTKTSNTIQKYASNIHSMPSPSGTVHRQVSKLPAPPSEEKPDQFYYLDRNGERCLSEINPNVIVQPTPKPKKMAELIKRLGSDGRIRHVRDQHYFAWRYLNPLTMYRFLFWGINELEGYLILQKSIYPKYRRVSIVDWEATNTQARADLLGAAIHCINWANSAYLNVWSATLPDEAKMLLNDIGFKGLEERESIKDFSPIVLVRAVRGDMLNTDWILAGRNLLDLSNWDLRMTYSDGY